MSGIQASYRGTGIWRGPVGLISSRVVARITGQTPSPLDEDAYEQMGAHVVTAVLGYGKKPRGVPLERIELRWQSKQGSLVLKADVPGPLTVRARRKWRGMFREQMRGVMQEYRTRAGTVH